MINTINAGVIGCDMSEDFFKTTASNTMERFNWTKILSPGKISENIAKEYPGVTIVNDVNAIVNDEEITLVIVASKNLELAKPVIEAGKSVRII
ncbi:Gfo/Idh/MocA family oxidoreductase [Segetibacter koreensis]|uniref:Gfo/Idh/MocA family oxidoreductase n=1 Tax=Segetibacter koreensis TaxID=398037 RepID=UPI0012F89533|nr:Gfo/Idh/MocA family oxidoreductase [Segetibacter koreensis]